MSQREDRIERHGKVLRGRAARDARQRLAHARSFAGFHEELAERRAAAKVRIPGRPRKLRLEHEDRDDAPAPRKPPAPPPTARMRKLRAAKWSYAQIARVVGLTTPEVAAMFGEANPMSFRTAGAP